MQIYFIFTFLLIVQFIDINIGSMPIRGIILFLVFIFFFITRKIFFRTMSLFLICLFIYTVYSSINLYEHTQNLSIFRGYLRPVVILISVFIQLYLALYFFREGAGYIIPSLIIGFLLFEFVLLIFGIVDNRYMKNEKGLHANVTVFLIYLLLRQCTSLKLIIIPIISLASTLSSSVLALSPLLLMKKRISLIIVLMFVPLLYFVFEELVLSKIGLLLSPPDDGTYGGRYWSNLIYIEQIKSSFLFGSGIESLFLYKKFHYFVESFDHGGSDLLRILSEFGIIGTIFLYVTFLKIHKNIMKYGYKIDYLGLIIVFVLSIKGIQIFSHPGMLLMILFVIYKKNNFILKRKMYINE